MADLNWVDSMSVGIPEFDAAHKGFITALRDISAALDGGRLDEAERLCTAFLTLAQEHGRQEVAFLRRNRFPHIQNVIDTQAATQKKIGALQVAIGRDSAEARRMMEDMEAAIVAYLLRGDINFKSFVQELVDQGTSIDSAETEEE